MVYIKYVAKVFEPCEPWATSIQAAVPDLPHFQIMKEVAE